MNRDETHAARASKFDTMSGGFRTRTGYAGSSWRHSRCVFHRRSARERRGSRRMPCAVEESGPNHARRVWELRFDQKNQLVYIAKPHVHRRHHRQQNHLSGGLGKRCTLSFAIDRLTGFIRVTGSAGSLYSGQCKIGRSVAHTRDHSGLKNSDFPCSVGTVRLAEALCSDGAFVFAWMSCCRRSALFRSSPAFRAQDEFSLSVRAVVQLLRFSFARVGTQPQRPDLAPQFTPSDLRRQPIC